MRHERIAAHPGLTEADVTAPWPISPQVAPRPIVEAEQRPKGRRGMISVSLCCLRIYRATILSKSRDALFETPRPLLAPSKGPR
jgi:hypothetical protein